MKTRALQLFSFGLVSIVVTAPAAAVSSPGDILFINEIHYDNIGTDVGEFIEIAGPAGTNLSGWSIVLYNGTSLQKYRIDDLSGIGSIPNQGNGYGTVAISYATDGLQNGAPDGIALVDNPTLTVVQFLSYEGMFTANDGAASGLLSTDIGVAETSSTPVGGSLHLIGTGTTYGDFSWAMSADDSPGSINFGQTFDPTLFGDYDNNGFVDAADYVLWRNGGPLLNDATEGVQAADYGVWRSHFGESAGNAAVLHSVPESSAFILALAAFAVIPGLRRRAASHNHVERAPTGRVDGLADKRCQERIVEQLEEHPVSGVQNANRS